MDLLQLDGAFWADMGVAPEEFRTILSRFASGVTVITTRDLDGRPTGLTVTAFSSVSLEPPLVLVCVDLTSESYPVLLAHGMFAVHVLTVEQELLSKRFATKRPDKFDGIPHHSGELGLPLLDGALSVLECRTVDTYPGGDHTIFIGEVKASHVGTGEPLLYYRGGYNRLATANGQPPRQPHPTKP